jgi:Xaa-Pro aminopeptidase
MASKSLPLPEYEYRKRLKIVRDRVNSEGYAGMLAFSGYAERDGNVCYLCGHKNAFPYSAKTEQVSGLGYSALLIPTAGNTILIAPLGYQPDAALGVDNAKTGTNFAHELISAMKDTGLGSSKLAVAGSDIIPAIYVDELRREFAELSLEYRDEILTDLRMVKSENELKLMRHASRIADEAMSTAMRAIKPGIKESTIGSIARRVAMEAGADYVVRDRVHSGKEMGQLRWPFASSKKVRRGELVSIDFVGWVKSYGFDILRIGCAGRPNKQQRKLIETAEEATVSMSEALTDQTEIGTSIGVLKELERDGFKVSAFGHGIGLEIVENPYLFAGVSGKIRENMVLCVEPDVRWKRSFASIENEIIVGPNKSETLTRLPVFW